MIPRIGQISGPNARSTQGVKIHTSASAKRDDKSAIRTKMQPSGVPSSPAGADERRPSHTQKCSDKDGGPETPTKLVGRAATRTPGRCNATRRSRYAALPPPPSRSVGHGSQRLYGLLVAGAGEREKRRGGEPGLLDRRRGIFFQITL